MKKVNKKILDTKVVKFVLIFLILICASVIFYALISSQKTFYKNVRLPTTTNNEQKNIENTKPVPEVTPTLTPTDHPLVQYEIPEDYSAGSYKITTKIDKEKETISLVVIKDGVEKLIEVIPYDTYSRFGDFLISSNYKYLEYTSSLGGSGFGNRLYNLENGIRVDLTARAGDSGFTKDNKYFYCCNESGHDSGMIQIYNLETMKFELEKSLDVVCKYNEEENMLEVTPGGSSLEAGDIQKSTFKYSFELGRVIN